MHPIPAPKVEEEKVLVKAEQQIGNATPDSMNLQGKSDGAKQA